MYLSKSAIISFFLLFSIHIYSQNFESTWEIPVGLFELPLKDYTDITIDWGDGQTSNHNDGVFPTHDYSSSSTFTITIQVNDAGLDIGSFFFIVEGSSHASSSFIKTIENWGDGKWENFHGAFHSAINLTIPATDEPDLSRGPSMYAAFYKNASLVGTTLNDWDTSLVTDMKYMFSSKSDGTYPLALFNGDISGWDTSNVDNMAYMFRNASSFNQDISAWDTSSVTDMKHMFEGASAFNQDISAWNTAAVTNMAEMFYGASAFNQDINTSGDSWNTAAVTDMNFMFSQATAFDGNISEWDTSSVTDMSFMFYEASVFNQDISNWNTAEVTDMGAMFERALLFDQNINTNLDSWNTEKVTKMYQMFWGATTFNGNISGWNTAVVTDMDLMFEDAVAFNQDISNWNTAAVTSMNYMFTGATLFNQDISTSGDIWNTSNVTEMREMFKNATNFNGDISGWDTSSVTDMYSMFHYADVFNQDISSWNTSLVTDMTYMFYGAYAFNQDINTVGDSWNISLITSLEDMFRDAENFNGNISEWDTSSVTDMRFMFSGATLFNQDISAWNTSSVTYMVSMFRAATLFNQDISAWNTSSVTEMDSMFEDAYAFNQDISAWNTSSVTDMDSMFEDASAFNQDINTDEDSWNTSSVTDMRGMFDGATVFNGDISGWDTSSVTDMYRMFEDASAFNQDISAWNTSSVTDMDSMFEDAAAFNQDINTDEDSWNTSSVTEMDDMFDGATNFNGNISGWDTSSVTEMDDMFDGATVFNQDISLWDTSKVEWMYRMFEDAAAFNQDISGWDTSLITDMDDMFDGATNFNGNISGWDTSSVTEMRRMFKNAAAFNQDISQWDINDVTRMTEMFNGATSFSTINYDLFLASSAGNASIASDIEITFSSYYDDANSRNTLTGSKNWTITDLGHKPTADNLSVTADENSEDALTFSLSGSDVDSATLTYSIVDYPKGQIEVTGNSVNYRSGSESNSSDSFTFKVNNGTNDSDTATVSISINNINDVPTTSNTSASLIKDSTTSISLIGHDIDNSSSLTYTITQPTNGTASLSGSKVTYTPNSGYAGSDSFTYTVSDGIAPSNQSTVTITVFDSYLTTPIQIGSTINGTIAEDAFGSSIAMSQNGNVIAVGGETNNSTGYIKIYELSNGDWVQKGSTISGDEQSEYFADWKIGINADGTRISAGAPDNSTEAGVIRNYEFVAGTWVLLGSEIEQKNLETDSDFGWGLSMNAAGNTIISQAWSEHNESGLENTGAIFTYSYDSELQRWTQFGDEIYGEFKDDRFGYTSSISADGKIIAASSVNHIVNDDNVGYVRVFKIENNIWEPLGGDIESDLDLSEAFGAWISLSGDGHTISIGDENFDNPDGTLDVGAVKVFRYNTVTNVWDLLGTFYGYVENSNLYKSSLSDDGNTIIIGNNQNEELADTEKGYVEAYNYNGSSWDQIGSTIYGEAIGDEFGRFVDLSKDGRIMGITAPENNNGATDAGAVYMYRLTNNNPVGADQSVTVNEQEDITITLAGEDLDGDSLTYSIVSSAKGSVTLTGNSIIYNSLSDHWNSDTFTYKINDGTADSPTYTVNITITPINDAPTTSSISRATLFNNDTTINLVGSDFDFSDDLTFSIESNPKHGIATLNGNTVTYSPNTNYVGVDSFTYKTSDGTLDSNISTVTLSIYSKYLDTPTLINDKIKHGTAEVFSDFADIIAVNEDASRIIVAQETEYVEVYENKNNTWVQLGQTINDGNVNISSYNGIGINDKGNRIVIGYYDENSGDGLSKVYELNSGQWFQLGTEIKPPLVGDGGNAGYSVRISGDGNTVVMSNEFGHNSKGSFIVYNYNAMSGVDDGTWVQLGSEIIGEESSRLSTSVDISDDGTIVSVTNYDLTDPYVKVFKFNNSNKDWELLGDTIRPQSSDENPSADYAELSSDGYRLSYSCLDCGSSNNGWIEVYEYNTESQSWMILGSPIIGLANSKSGERSTISGDGNTVSSSTDQYDNDNSYVDIYKFNGTDWVSTSKVYLPTLQGAARSILSQDGTKITFSIDQDVEEGAFNKGSVSVYDLVSRFKPSTPNISASTIKNITEEIFLSGTDLDFDTLTGEIVSNPTNGTVSLEGKYATYAPNQGFTGQDTFTYKFNDGVLDSNISTVTITVFDAFVNTARQVGNTIKSLESDFNTNMVTTNKDGSIIAVSSEGGFVRVYKNIEGTWTQLGSVISEEYSSSDLGDGKLSMNNDGTRISIGDYNNEFVNVYDFIDDSWVQVGNKIESFDSGDGFGYPPSLSGDGSVLLSSGFESDINGDNSGAVYAYKFDGVNWVQLGQTIYGEEGDSIGYDAQINNDGTIIAMASYDNSYVKVFEYNSETQLWEQLGSNIVGEIEYIDISNDGKTILIIDPSNTDSGAAHIFKYDNDTSDWVAKGSTIYGVPDVKFYYASIDGSGNTVSLASYNSYDLGDKTNIGLIRNYTFDTDSSDWTQIGGDVVGEFSGDEIETAVLSSDGLIFITSSSDGYTDSTKPEENFGYVKVFSLQNFIPVADAQTVTAVEQTAKEITLTGSDLDGDAITYSIVDQPTDGIVTLDGATATYTSNSDTATSDSFTFKVNDGELDSETSTVTIEITAVNDVPTVDNQTVTVTENIAKEITLIGSDPDGDAITYSIVDQPTDGTVTLDGTTATYTSNSDTATSDSFTFKANDSEVDSNIATVTINIIPVDDAPIGNEQTVEAVEQVEKSITLTASDPESDTITLYAFKTTPSNGTATINNNVVTYTSNSDTATSDSFTFIVQANGLESIPTTVIINITGTNDAPVAENQTVNVTDKVTETITLLASDPENDALTYTIVDDPVYGTLTINGNKAKYTSNSESETTDSFTFKVDDGNLDSSIAIVSITTTLVNDAPTADNQTVEVNEQTTKEITLNAVDLEGSALTYSIVDKPKSGTVTLDGVIATYISNSNSATSDSFTFKVNDGELDSNTAIISINISNLDDSPTAINQTVEVDEQVAKEIKLVGNDPDGDAITYSIVDQPTDGTVTLDGATATYTSNSDTATSDSFTFKVNDGVTDSNIATISLNITAVNDAPNGNDQTINAVEQVAKEIKLVGNDPDGDAITYSIVDQPTDGTVTLDGATATYTSNSDTATSDSFTFKVNDGVTDSNIATISLNITAVNDAPNGNDQTINAVEQVEVIFTLTGSDPEQDDLTYAIVNPPSNGKVVIDGTSATYVSTSDTAIDDLFTFVVNDGNFDSERSSITIVIEPVNDEPTVANQTESVTEKVQSIFKLNGSDPEGQPITFTIINQPINGTISLNGREVTYTSSSETATTDSFTYKINDGELDSKTATVDIDILSNDLDNDGILNVDDKCPETPKGSRVDFNGCPIFSLPLDNNKVSIISASCIGNSDGSIGLSVEDASFNYTVTVTGQDDPITLGGEIKTASVTGLGTGTYTVCFKVDGQETYEQCFEVSIAEPKALSAFIDVDNDNKTTSIQLSGSSTYNVEVNGDRFEVKGDRFTTNLPSGLSIIKISTDLDCQGVIEREVFISEDIHYYPNPTEKDVNVHVSGEDTLVQVSVFSEKGDLIYTREQQIQDFSRKTNIDLSRQITGTYIVVMDGPTVRKTFKILKR